MHSYTLDKSITLGICLLNRKQCEYKHVHEYFGQTAGPILCMLHTFWFKNRSCLEYGNFIDHRDVEASHIQDCSVHSAENGQPVIVLHTSLCVCQIKSSLHQ